jgi:hypothetical protein
MRAHAWRGGAFRRPGNRFPRVVPIVFPRVFKRVSKNVFKAAAGTAFAAIVILTGTSLVRAGDGDRTERLDTEHLFGFVEGADIGARGEKEFMIDSTMRAGKSGAFTNTASDFEIKYTAFDNVRISTVATAAWYDIGGVAGMEDTRRAALQSLSADARFRVLDRERAPFGLTVSISPHWGFFDETSGVRASHFGGEIQVLADRELVRDRLAGAINLLFSNDRVRFHASDDLEKESLLGAGAALAAQIRPDVWIGGEARYLRDYSGAALNAFAGHAVYAGPTVYVRLGRNAFASAAWDFQIWGGAAAASGPLDLTNFERHQAKFRFGFEF